MSCLKKSITFQLLNILNIKIEFVYIKLGTIKKPTSTVVSSTITKPPLERQKPAETEPTPPSSPPPSSPPPPLLPQVVNKESNDDNNPDTPAAEAENVHSPTAEVTGIGDVQEEECDYTRVAV